MAISCQREMVNFGNEELLRLRLRLRLRDAYVVIKAKLFGLFPFESWNLEF